MGGTLFRGRCCFLWLICEKPDTRRSLPDANSTLALLSADAEGETAFPPAPPAASEYISFVH